MIAATFDTLAYSKKLKNAGFTEIQAEAIDTLEERLTYKLTLRLGGMFAAGITILATLIKLH